MMDLTTNLRVILPFIPGPETRSESSVKLGLHRLPASHEAGTRLTAGIPFSAEPRDETTSGNAGAEGFSMWPDLSDLVRPAWDATYQTENPEVAQRARKLLLVIQEVITTFAEQLRLDPDQLDPLHMFKDTDGSLLIEWIFPDFRIGFAIEVNIVDSGWYLASNRTLGNIAASGSIAGANIRGLVSWLVYFALLSS
jgi:hypothetical protein